MELATRSDVGFYIKLYREGVTIGQLAILEELNKHPRRVGQLAKLLDVSSSTMSGICDRLFDRGLVSRDSLTHDRRVVLMQITDKGKEMLLLE